MAPEHTISLGMTAEVLAAEYSITRDAQDSFALASHERALAAPQDGRFDAKLRPVIASDGTVTAGNSSPLNDGAAALLLASGDGCARFGLEPLARVVTWASGGVEPRRMGIGPAPALRLALDRAGWDLGDLAVIELNEAFAAQSLAVMSELGLDPELVNPLGGAIALGHPLGCSGARIATTLVHQLHVCGPGVRGAVTMCIGVGQGIATLFEAVTGR